MLPGLQIPNDGHYDHGLHAPENNVKMIWGVKCATSKKFAQHKVQAGQQDAIKHGYPAIQVAEGTRPPWQLSSAGKKEVSARLARIVMPLGLTRPGNPIRFSGLKAAEYVLLQGVRMAESMMAGDTCHGR